MKQGSKEWLAHRKNYIGASDAPVIMGCSPWRTPYQLWEEKLGLSKGQQENDAMRYGKMKEAEAIRAYEVYTGNIVSTDENDTLVYHSEKKFMMCSLDAISLENRIPVEVKNPNIDDHNEAKSGKVPEKYYPQVQHQLACLDFNLLHYFSYRNGDLALVEVERNQSYIDTLIAEESKFWDKVLNFDIPELTDRDYVSFDDEEWVQLARKWGNVTEQLALFEKKEKEYRAALITRAAGRNAIGCGVCLTKIVRKGSVDYKQVPELIGVDLDKYRKEPCESWRLTLKNGVRQ